MMDQRQEKSHSADLHSRLLDDHDRTPCKTSLEDSNQYISLDDTSLSPPRMKVDPVEVLPRHTSDWDGDWGIGQCLGDTLEGPELNGHESMSNSEIYESTCGRANKIAIDADSSQCVTETNSPVWSPESTYSRIPRNYPVPTPSQNSNTAESSFPWRQLGHWPEGSYTSLQPHIHALHNSSGAAHSHYSDSAWETIPSIPSADDYDLRSIPDDNSASVQSYNDPQLGIWPQENIYRQDQTYTSLMATRHDGCIGSAKTRLLPQNLREVCDRADAATPFATESDSHARTSAVNAALGAGETSGMAAPSFSLSIPRASVYYSPHIPSDGRSGVLVTNATKNLAKFPAEWSPMVEHVFLSPGRDQKTGPVFAPTISLDIRPSPATRRRPLISTDPQASTLSPSASTDAPTTGVAKCTHKECGAKFKGASRKDTLRRHKRVVHSNRAKPICPQCHIVIQSGRRDNWKRHIKDQHPGHPILESLNVRGKNLTANPNKGRTARQCA